MPFKTPLQLEKQNAYEWRLLGPLVYEGRSDKFTVPAGTWTDLASIPRLLWVFLPPIGPHDEAAVIHDDLYASHRVSRWDADGIFRRILKESGVGFFARWSMWLGVRLGGWWAWRDR